MAKLHGPKGQEAGRSPGRVRLRPNRGLPLPSPYNATPTKFSFESSKQFTLSY